MGFIALGNEPWWTLKGTTSDQIVNIGISPFYVLLDGIGLPSTVPFASLTGTLTRVLLVSATVLLGLSALWPRAWWRKLAVWLSLSSLTEVYLSFTLLMNSTRTAIINTYGANPPMLGTDTLPGSILGLDLAYYTNPSVSASFALPFYLGFLSLALVGGAQLVRNIRNPEQLQVASELTKGVKEVHLAPPYQSVWLSSTDQDLNPLIQDPDRLTDDQLAISFEKLNKTLQPGGIIKVVLPAWAASLSERLLRLVPWAGFSLEKSDLIYRTPGKPENELVFRKPIVKQEPPPQQAPEPPQTKASALVLTPELIQPSQPPVTDLQAEPAWAQPQMTRQERVIIKTAAGIITRRKEPVPYRELVNEVYVDLLDRKIEFESAKQIETILLRHAGKELVIIEELDQTNARVVRKWWLGDKGLESGQGEPLNLWKRISSKAKPKLQVLQLVKKWQRQHKQFNYKPKKNRDED